MHKDNKTNNYSIILHAIEKFKNTILNVTKMNMENKNKIKNIFITVEVRIKK